MPAPVLERLALELALLLGVLAFVFVSIVRPVPAPDDDLELPAEQHADRRLDRAHLERTEQHHDIEKLEFLHLAGRVRLDQQLHIQWRAFQRELKPQSC